MKGESNMPKPELQEQTTQETEESSLKGTLMAVMILGLFIIVSWFGVWALYMSR